MIVVSGTMVFEPESHDAVLAAAKDLVAATLEESGCRTYGFWVDPEQRGRFRVFEEWDGQEALTAHFSAPHFVAFGELLGGLGLVGMDVHRYCDPEVRDLF